MILNTIIYFFICFLQPIMLPFPEPVTIMAGSLVLGRFNGAIIGFLGTTLGIITMYFISKYIGNKFLLRFIKKDSLDKFNNYIIKNETLILLLLFVFPLLPDEVICIGSGIAKLNPYKFIFIALLSKLITTFTISYSIKLFKFNIETLIVCFSLVIVFIYIKSILKDRKSA